MGWPHFAVCRHVWDVAYSTSHKPTLSGLVPVVKKIVDVVVATPLPNQKFADPEFNLPTNR